MAMKNLYLKLHLGLGDIFICNGLVRALTKGWQMVTVPAKPHNLATVQWMFSDEPRVHVIQVADDAEMICRAREPYLGLGLWSERGLHAKHWDQQFYADAGLPFETRWSHFKIPGFPKDGPTLSVDCAFLHEDRKRGYHIDRTLIDAQDGIYEPVPAFPFWSHIAPLEMCREIHVIDSCFLALADSLPLREPRRVLHQYATKQDPYKKLGPPTLRYQWETLT